MSKETESANVFSLRRRAPVSRPARTEITDEGDGVSVVAELIIILALLSSVLL
jgi:hypothetical protein